MTQVNIAIDSTSLKGLFDAKREFHDDLEAIVCYFSDGHREIILISFDLVQLSVPFCNEFRHLLAEKCRLDMSAIVTHCTHTHTSPGENELRSSGISNLVDRIANVVKRARKSAKPALISFAQVNVGKNFNINRRKKIDSLNATFTVWYGYNENAGQPDASWQIERRLEILTGRKIKESEYNAPVIYDGQTDEIIQAISFCSENGQPIGTIVRYSAHPCIAAHTQLNQRMYSADFPGVIRKVISSCVGGNVCFLTGPCGNIAPWSKGSWDEIILPEDKISLSPLWMPHRTSQECWSQVDSLGTGIANAIIPQIKKAKFAKIDKMNFISRLTDINIRNDIFDDTKHVDIYADELYRKFLKMRANSPVPEIISFAHKINFLRMRKFFYSEYYYLNPEQARSRKLQIEMPAVLFNDIAMIGFIGEVFHEVQNPLRKHASELAIKTFCFTQANGDIGYIPTADQKTNDDYECYCSVTAKGASEQLSEAAIEIINDMKNEKEY